jgi:opacity protein-like surface antigen
MKMLKLLLGSLLVLGFINPLFSMAATPPEKNFKAGDLSSGSLITYAIPDAFYNYYDFKFDSTVGANYNRFQGHSNQYGVGANTVSLPLGVMAGIYVYRVDTDVNAQFLLAPALPFVQTQSSKNDTALFHLLKRFGFVVIDVAGAYGHNQINSKLIIAPNTAGASTGFGHSVNDAWFASIGTLFAKNWPDYYVKGNIRVLHSEVKSGNYQMVFMPTFNMLNVAPLTTKSTWVMENVEAGYKLSDMVTPFVTGGLVQAADYKATRPLIASPFVGGLPQLNANKNGFKVGAGVTLTHDKLAVRIEQKYYKTGSIYSSNQTLVRMIYFMT